MGFSFFFGEIVHAGADMTEFGTNTPKLVTLEMQPRPIRLQVKMRFPKTQIKNGGGEAVDNYPGDFQIFVSQTFTRLTITREITREISRLKREISSLFFRFRSRKVRKK